MKLLRVITAFLLLTCPTFAADRDLTFGGVQYQLAHVEVAKDGSVTNEYVPAGETIDSWTTLIGVRHWPKAAKVGEVGAAWLQMVQPLLTQKPGIYRSSHAKNGDDVVLEGWLLAPDKSYLEINLHRFVAEEGTQGVKAYQFAFKIATQEGKADPKAFLSIRAKVFQELGQLRLALHQQMPK